MLAITLTLLAALWSHVAGCSLLVADMTMSKMVELRTDAPLCALYTDRDVIQRMVHNADPNKVRKMSDNLVAELEESCKAWLMGKTPRAGGGMIYPGTYWCGSGNSASSYDELGHHAAEDACCREHDHCPKALESSRCIEEFCNTSSFTRSHCDCDAKFRRCLQNLNSEVAKTIGYLFFNAIQMTCFKERRPCSQWQSCPLEWENSPKFELSMRDHVSKAVVFLKTIPEVACQALNKTIYAPLRRLFG